VQRATFCFAGPASHSTKQSGFSLRAWRCWRKQFSVGRRPKDAGWRGLGRGSRCRRILPGWRGCRGGSGSRRLSRASVREHRREQPWREHPTQSIHASLSRHSAIRIDKPPAGFQAQTRKLHYYGIAQARNLPHHLDPRAHASAVAHRSQNHRCRSSARTSVLKQDVSS